MGYNITITTLNCVKCFGQINLYRLRNVVGVKKEWKFTKTSRNYSGKECTAMVLPSRGASAAGGGQVSLQIRQIRVTNEREGISCCGVCRICTCIKWGFIFSPLGAIKVAEFVSIRFSFAIHLYYMVSISSSFYEQLLG